MDKPGYIYLQIPFVHGLDTSGLVISTSVGTGKINSSIPANEGMEIVTIKGKIMFNQHPCFISLSIEVPINKDKTTHINIPHIEKGFLIM